MQLFVDHLTVIDCSYLHPEHGIEGESWIVDVTLEGDLNDQSMILDFGIVKKRIKQLIDASADHALLVPQRSAALQALEVQNTQETTLEWRDAKGRSWMHTSPACALCLMDCEHITAALVQQHLQQMLAQTLESNIAKISISLRSETLHTPYYHYSHGLKKHDGNCQRIAHGHRSKLEIWRNGALAEQAIKDWCARWAHVYLVSAEDILRHEKGYIESGYHAPQGHFWLRAPEEACVILPHDSTVECIADYLAQTLKAQEPAASWRVKAYEGVFKGAVVQL